MAATLKNLGFVLATGIVMAGLFSFAWPAAASSFAARDLLELGVIEMPSRLEPRPADETAQRVLFRFDRVVDSFFFMGSSTPFRERLVVAVSPSLDAAAIAAWDGEFRELARDRVEDIRWQRNGAFEVGSGIHRVNTRETPAWVLLLGVPEHRLRLGYMAWQKGSSLEEAKALLQRIAASYAPAMQPEDFFARVRARQERPAAP